MNVIVRLYWQHDLDLVALTLHPMFEMGKWMKKAMIAYAQGDEEFHSASSRNASRETSGKF